MPASEKPTHKRKSGHYLITSAGASKVEVRVETTSTAQGAVAPASGDALRRGNFSRTLRLNMDLKFVKPANEG
jgi:hypothetical protein